MSGTPKPRLQLAWCSAEAARYACLTWHYARSVPVGRVTRIGVWEDGRYIGCILVTRGSGRATDGRRFGLRRAGDIAEVQRIALREHKTPVSRMLSIAIRMIQRASPNLKMLISFADPTMKHAGGIYQAANWIYLGTTAPDVGYRLPSGRVVHPRVARGTTHFGRRRRTILPPGTTHIALPGKHIYVYPFTEALRQECRKRAQPYPKTCAGSVENDAPADQAGEGGAIPTPALQAAILQALDNSLRRQKYQNNPNPVAGHCYVSSEALYYLLGGPQGEWMPQFIRHESEQHWFLRHRRTGAVLDLTASQFQTSVPYAKGRRQAFLTSGPSRRAQVVIARVRNALAVP